MGILNLILFVLLFSTIGGIYLFMVYKWDTYRTKLRIRRDKRHSIKDNTAYDQSIEDDIAYQEGYYDQAGKWQEH